LSDDHAPLSPADQLLKLKTKALVAAVGGQEAAPGFARIKRHQAYSEYGSVACPDKFMTLDVARDLEAVTVGTPGHPIITRHLAECAGGVFVKLPDGPPGGDCFHRANAELATEFADVCGSISLALVNGSVDAGEVRQLKLRQHCRDLIEVVMQLDAMFEQIEAEG
jgi:hypothetical protein